MAVRVIVQSPEYFVSLLLIKFAGLEIESIQMNIVASTAGSQLFDLIETLAPNPFSSQFIREPDNIDGQPIPFDPTDCASFHFAGIIPDKHTDAVDRIRPDKSDVVCNQFGGEFVTILKRWMRFGLNMVIGHGL